MDGALLYLGIKSSLCSVLFLTSETFRLVKSRIQRYFHQPVVVSVALS